MPTLSEFIMTIGLRFREADDKTETFFRFETIREFQSFRYEVDVESSFDAPTREITFIIKGVRAPLRLMSSTGRAVTEFSYALPDGEYLVSIVGAKQTGGFRFKRRGQGIKLTEVEEGNFVQVHLADKMEVIRA